MLSEHTVEDAARAAGIGAPAHYLPVTGSTNADLMAMAERGAPEWTVVAAGHQEHGRGRLGRSWASSPGSSLQLSVLVRPSLPPDRWPLLSLAAGACAAEACRVACNVDVRCKWPNDLMAGDRKLGGVLIEAKTEGREMAFAVIGVGVNVRQGLHDLPPELRESATSVALQGGRPDTARLLREFLARLRNRCDPHDPDFPATVLAAYRPLSGTIGRAVRARTTSGREVAGRAVDVGPAGELLVQTDGSVEAVGSGEVEYLR